MLPCLMLFSACSTTEQGIVVQERVIKSRIPAALLSACPAKQRGPLPTTQAIVNRLLYTEAGIDCRDAKFAGIRKWNAQ